MIEFGIDMGLTQTVMFHALDVHIVSHCFTLSTGWAVEGSHNVKFPFSTTTSVSITLAGHRPTERFAFLHIHSIVRKASSPWERLLGLNFPVTFIDYKTWLLESMKSQRFPFLPDIFSVMAIAEKGFSSNSDGASERDPQGSSLASWCRHFQ